MTDLPPSGTVLCALNTNVITYLPSTGTVYLVAKYFQTLLSRVVSISKFIQISIYIVSLLIQTSEIFVKTRPNYIHYLIVLMLTRKPCEVRRTRYT